MSEHEHAYLIGENKSFVEGVPKTQYDEEMADTLKLENKGTAGGVAELDSTGKVPEGQLPTLSGILAGTIVAFSGTFSGKNPIPKGGTIADTGWHICDGTDGTPDLRNKFVYGGDGTNTGETGGSTYHDHSINGDGILKAAVGYHTLSSEEMPSHNHSLGHYWGTSSSDSTSFEPASYGSSTPESGYRGGGGSHNHPLSGSTDNRTILPPYYVLAYIIKL